MCRAATALRLTSAISARAITDEPGWALSWQLRSPKVPICSGSEFTTSFALHNLRGMAVVRTII